MADMYSKGRQGAPDHKGEKNGSAELCELDVWLIRNIEGQTQRAIADWFDIAVSTTNYVINHKTWRHL